MPETDYWVDNYGWAGNANDTRPSLFQDTSQPAPKGYQYQEIPNDADRPGPPQYQLVQAPRNPYASGPPRQPQPPVKIPDVYRGGFDNSPAPSQDFFNQNRWASFQDSSGQPVTDISPYGGDASAVMLGRARDLGAGRWADYMQTPHGPGKRPKHYSSQVDYMNRQGQPFDILNHPYFAQGLSQDPRQTKQNLDNLLSQFGGIRETYKRPSVLSQVMRAANAGTFALAGGLVAAPIAGPIAAGAVSGGLGSAVGSGGDPKATALGVGTGALAGWAAPYLKPVLGDVGTRLATDTAGAAVRSGIQNKGTPNPYDVGIAAGTSLVGSGIRAAMPTTQGPFINTPGEPGGGFQLPPTPHPLTGPVTGLASGTASAAGHSLYDDFRRKQRRNPYMAR